MASSLQFRVTKSGSRSTLKGEAGERLKQAVKAYEEAKGSLSIRQAAWLYAVSKTTLYHRTNGRQDQVSHVTSSQRLTLEGSLQSWVLQVQSWEFPLRIAQLRKMAGDFKELGKNQTEKFLNHHPILSAKFGFTTAVVSSISLYQSSTM